MNDTVPLAWTHEELEQTPMELLALSLNTDKTPAFRADAYRKSEAKVWFERIILASIVHIDINQIDTNIARDVVQLRTLIGTTAPWLERNK